MGKLQAWLPNQNGVLDDFSPPQPPPSPGPHPLNPRPSEIGVENWRRAEKATGEVIETIQATLVSERRRQEVIEYVQRLIRGCLGSEVFPYGSVPLKTYLPDGDIDLTALGLPNSEDILASNVRHVLEAEEKNKDAEFEVKDVQYIHAEVKLVKCLVQNIVVDISFNQSGGLSTLCFLELVDRMIGKGHLFKRSIILIKAWCYYESRILGAHHGLISTYAMETLVLYIFHLYNSSLDGPLAVLYRFLDYYSKFDWDNYCISLYGPISMSSLPELVAEPLENSEFDLFFSKEFLKNCAENFWLRGLESNSRTFPQKHLNIVDPLREINNLGRSVSKGNFYRIRSAFTYGARNLGKILLQPSENIDTEVNLFFANTLDRHGTGERPDVQGAFPACLESTTLYNNGLDFLPLSPQATSVNRELCEGVNDMTLLGLENVSRNRMDDAKEKNKDLLSTSQKNLPTGKTSHIPYLFVHPENGCQNGGPSQPNSSNLVGQSVSSTRPISPNEEVSVYVCETESSTSSKSWFTTHGPASLSWASEQPQPIDFPSAGGDTNGTVAGPGPTKFADLTGDYSMQLSNFFWVQWSHEYVPGAVFPFYPQSPSNQYQNKHSWDPHWRRGLFAHMSHNGVVPGPPFPSPGSYLAHFPAGPYGMEESPKPRGTGTYFPNTNYRTYRERHSPGRGRTSVPPNYFSRHRHNGRAETPLDADLQERVGNEPPPPQLRLPAFTGSGRGKPAMVEASSSARPRLRETAPVTSSVLPADGKLEFGSFSSWVSPSSEAGRRVDSPSPHTQGSQVTFPAPALQRPSSSSNLERSAQVYQLKDVGDFPPLGV